MAARGGRAALSQGLIGRATLGSLLGAELLKPCLEVGRDACVALNVDALEGLVSLDIYNPRGGKRLTAVPYFIWDNRAPGRMDVWLDRLEPSRGTGLYRSASV